MNSQDFKKLLERRFERSRSVLMKKNEEYGTGQDVLESFKEQADFSMHQEPTSIGWELLVKHLYSVRRIIAEYECDDTVPSQEMIDEKFGDAINYLMLLEALFKEISLQKQNPNE